MDNLVPPPTLLSLSERMLSLSERMARTEAVLERLLVQNQRELEINTDIHKQLTTLLDRQSTQIEEVDERIDRIEITVAKAFGALAVVVFLANLLAPSISKALGLPT